MSKGAWIVRDDRAGLEAGLPIIFSRSDLGGFEEGGEEALKVPGREEGEVLGWAEMAIVRLWRRGIGVAVAVLAVVRSSDAIGDLVTVFMVE